MRKHRQVLIVLPTDSYQALTELAERETRTVGQQAAFLVRRALDRADPGRVTQGAADGRA